MVSITYLFVARKMCLIPALEIPDPSRLKKISYFFFVMKLKLRPKIMEKELVYAGLKVSKMYCDINYLT